MEPDFSGYATKSGLRCTDGRTIMPGAFSDQSGSKVPLVWQHGHNDPMNVLGHAQLEERQDGVYAYGYFNDTESAKQAKNLVEHGDINSMSIYANKLVEKSRNVMHGKICEVSLVLSGANPGALIDNVNIRHSDGDVEQLDDEAIIYTGEALSLQHEYAKSPATNNTKTQENNMPTNNSDKTVQDVFDEMTEEQQNVVYFMVGAALEDAGVTDDDNASVAQSDDGTPFISHKEAFEMTRNVFEMANSGSGSLQHDDGDHRVTLSHSDVQEIVQDAKRMGSFKEAVLEHAVKYGIENIDFLFPDARTVTNDPNFIQRRTEWVSTLMDGVKKSPFAKIKTINADITAEEARARGYVKGNLKKEEVIKLLRRTTEPTTIYKKQKLDRDDIIDITDLDVVAWLKAEMRIMLDEELARAILIGDGRSESSEDKINEEKIRPIANDHALYAHPVEVSNSATPEEIIEQLIRARANYRGTGQPTFYTSLPFLTDMLLLKDKMGRRLYKSKGELAAEIMAKDIVDVEVMENSEVLGIYVNPSDYTVGANRGGEISMFDDFDIDYNQHKYLIETRVSGALAKPKSAVVIKTAKGVEVTPTSPSFESSTNTITIPTTEGVIYSIDGVPVTGKEVIAETTQVDAKAKKGFSFAKGAVANWTFVFTPKNGG